MEPIKYSELHQQAQYVIMKVLRGDARGGMTSIDPRAGTTVAGFNNTAGRMTHTSIQ